MKLAVLLALANPSAAVSGTVNANTATHAELMELPGLTSKQADRILYERRRCPYFVRTEIKRALGFAEYSRLRDYLSVRGETTINRRNPR